MLAVDRGNKEWLLLPYCLAVDEVGEGEESGTQLANALGKEWPVGSIEI